MGIQDYFRKQNIFGSPNVRTPSFFPEQSTQDIFGPRRPPMENIDVQVDDTESESPATDAFRESVLNPPQHQNPSWLRTAGTAALSALQGSNEPDPNDKTRVMVDGQAYQKRGVIVGPDGVKHYVGGVKPRGFWDSLGNKPFDVKEAGEIMNMPNAQRLADWKIRTGGLKDAATLENKDEINRALSAQRYANAAAIPQKVDQGQQKINQTGNLGQQKIDLAKKNLELNQRKLDHVMSREDLTDTEKAALTNRYKREQMQLQGEINANAAETRGDQRLEEIDARGVIDKDIQNLRGTQASTQIGERGDEARETAEVAGEQARETKAAPSGTSNATSQLPTQQKVAIQLKANKAKQDHPEWAKYIKTDSNGMTVITPPSDGGWLSSGPDKDMYDAIKSYMNDVGPAAAKPPDKAPPISRAAPPPKGNSVPADRVVVYDMSGKAVSTIPIADVARLNKKKYTTVKPNK